VTNSLLNAPSPFPKGLRRQVASTQIKKVTPPRLYVKLCVYSFDRRISDAFFDIDDHTGLFDYFLAIVLLVMRHQ
jgi:hypothetical protein